MECQSCQETFNEKTLKKHAIICESLQKLIKNERQCRLCEKSFESKPAINGHVAFVHKKALLELENQKSVPIMPLCEPSFEPENQKTATTSAAQTSVNENPE